MDTLYAPPVYTPVHDVRDGPVGRSDNGPIISAVIHAGGRAGSPNGVNIWYGRTRRVSSRVGPRVRTPVRVCTRVYL